MRKIKLNFILLILLINIDISFGQKIEPGSVEQNSKKLKTLIIGSSVLYSTSLITLDRLWYRDFPREGFHFFNDSHEWKQVDKIGHGYTAFHISSASAKALQWSGVNSRKSYVWGGVMGFLSMTPIEIMDGYSSEYGASLPDLAFNALGAALFVSQGILWDEIRIHPKFSFTRSDYPKSRPQILGDGFSEELLKDYNGQTYWLSFDIARIIPSKEKIPTWINLAIGYGANDMIYASDLNNYINGLSPYRQYYLALDVDLSHIQSQSRLVNTLLYLINMIHLPAPALELTSNGQFTFHALKF